MIHNEISNLFPASTIQEEEDMNVEELEQEEKFGSEQEGEALDESETQEDEDEGVGDGKLGRSKSNFPPK